MSPGSSKRGGGRRGVAGAPAGVKTQADRCCVRRARRSGRRGGCWRGELGGVPLRPWIPGTDVTLQTYVTDRCGYQLVGITSGSIEMTYKTVPTPTEPADRPACTADTLSVSLRRT